MDFLKFPVIFEWRLPIPNGRTQKGRYGESTTYERLKRYEKTFVCHRATYLRIFMD